MSEAKNQTAHAAALRTREYFNAKNRRNHITGVLITASFLGAIGVGGLTASVPQLEWASVYAVAQTGSFLFASTDLDPTLTLTYNGREYDAGVKEWATSQDLKIAATALVEHVGEGAAVGLVLGCLGLGLTRNYRRQLDKNLLANRIVAGTRIVNEETLANMTAAKNSPHALRIGSVSISSERETRHVGMVGVTGTGKTTALRQMLDCIEARGHFALVYDTTGDFISHYYNPHRGDIILNPFDDRGTFWNPADEITHPADAARIGYYLITETGDRDRDVWLETARTLVANILRKLCQQNRGTLQALLEALQSMPREELERLLVNTSSARTFEKDAERATASVLFMLSKAINMLMFLRAAPREGEVGFSFARFFSQIDKLSGKKPWIFIAKKEDYFEAMKPLMACWLECAASGVLGLTPNRTRRLFFLLDELADLPHVANLERLLPQGRKFGASVILSFQAIGQMTGHYGREQAEALLSSCNTKLFLQLTDRDTRNWASDTIGSVELEIQTVSDTLDTKTGEPQQTLSTTREVRPAVLESELRLPLYTGFLLLPDGSPVAKIKLTDTHITARGPARHPPYIPAKISETLWGKEQSKPENNHEELDTSKGPV